MALSLDGENQCQIKKRLPEKHKSAENPLLKKGDLGGFQEVISNPPQPQ
jgi:hypothetical protein